jgi:UPF0755 protein
VPIKVKHSVFLISLIASALLALILAKAYLAVYRANPYRPQGDFAEVDVKPGMSVQTLALLMKEKGVIRSASEFVFSAKLLRLDDQIQAGLYPLPYGRSNAQLLVRLSSAGASAALITIPEGMTSQEIAQLLEKRCGLDSAAFMEVVRDSALRAANRISAPSLEGFLFPDSYHIYREMKPEWIVQRMVDRFYQIFDSTMQTRAAAMGMSVVEAVTLASIIEGEMFDPAEDGCISAVYHNRLKKNMLLQADPTIQYIIMNNRRRLFRSDLAVESPYNTYLHRGLPPGPVCNPGKRALRAALHPDAVPYLFMVSQGDGTHAFSTNLTDHLRAKEKLDSLRQMLALSAAAARDSLQIDQAPK